MQREVGQADVVGVEANGMRREGLVVGKRPAAPVDMSYAVKALVKVEVNAVGLGAVHEGLHGNGVARRAEGKANALQADIVEVNLPEIRARRSVGLSGIAQLNEERGVAQQRRIDAHMLMAEVDAVGFEPQLAHLSRYPDVADEMGGVDLHLAERQLVDHHLLVQQRPQLHRSHHTTHVGHRVVDALERVVGLKHLHVFQ